MKLLDALTRDPRLTRLGDRKAVAVELLVRRLDAILDGDEHYPANWLLSIDICRQEAGIAQLSALSE